NENVLAAETLNGQIVQPEGTDDYYVLTGDQDGRVMRVRGLNSVQRLAGGSVTLTEEDHQRAADALREYERQRARAESFTIVRGRNTLEDHDGITKKLDRRHGFNVRAAYDNENLYLQYDVTAPHELANTVSDPKLLFTGGNLIDLQLATDPQADPDRDTPAPGDVRLLIGRDGEGAPLAVRYRPNVEDFDGEPTTFRSPQDTESFDAIDEVSDRIALEYEPNDVGFTATATIPLDVLGWQPTPASTVKLDVGYIFGNDRGSNATRRAYWSNNSFHANVVDDVPDESRLDPHEWGTATVE
ncbi:MAG: hypothetical protein ACODAQ_06665, partial [Phycisphaeraceae bacterium]